MQGEADQCYGVHGFQGEADQCYGVHGFQGEPLIHSLTSTLVKFLSLMESLVSRPEKDYRSVEFYFIFNFQFVVKIIIYEISAINIVSFFSRLS